MRRLSLAAAGSGALALLLRATPGEEHVRRRDALDRRRSAARRAAACMASARRVCAAHLVRNRRGHLGSWTLE